MDDEKFYIEIIKIIISLSTPILVAIIGCEISKKIENYRLNALKEKEWQVKWAELFFKHATDFNDNISIVISLLFHLQNKIENSEIDEDLSKIQVCQIKLSEIDWNIRNYAQFSEQHGKKVTEIQEKLLEDIKKFLSCEKKNLEEFRKEQFEYNTAVRLAHNEILKIELPAK